MTKESLNALKRGDVVRHESGTDDYVVTANYGDRVTAVRSVDLTNPVEWRFMESQPRTPEEIAAYHESVERAFCDYMLQGQFKNRGTWQRSGLRLLRAFLPSFWS